MKPMKSDVWRRLHQAQRTCSGRSGCSRAVRDSVGGSLTGSGSSSARRRPSARGRRSRDTISRSSGQRDHREAVLHEAQPDQLPVGPDRDRGRLRRSCAGAGGRCPAVGLWSLPSPALVLDARVDEAVQDVGEEVAEDHHDAADHHGREHDRVVARLHALDQPGSPGRARRRSDSVIAAPESRVGRVSPSRVMTGSGRCAARACRSRGSRRGPWPSRCGRSPAWRTSSIDARM